jgi:hypothetical protein
MHSRNPPDSPLQQARGRQAGWNPRIGRAREARNALRDAPFRLSSPAVTPPTAPTGTDLVLKERLIGKAPPRTNRLLPVNPGREDMLAARWKVLPLMVALMGAGPLGCDGDPASVGKNATVQVLLTDAPSDYIGHAFVDIGQVQIIPAGEGGPITLSEDGTDGEVDLMELRGAVTTLLAEGVVEPGTYTQLRLIVESARVVLGFDGDEQYKFTDGMSEQEMKVPSGAQTGIKLNLKPAQAGGEGQDGAGSEGGVYIAPGETVLILDFDVSRSFVIQGNPETPAGIKSVHFKPTLRVIVQDGAGSISGAVSTQLTDVSVEGLDVTAEPEEDTYFGEYQTQSATAETGPDGKYTIPHLVPGSYTVSVTPPAGLVMSPTSAMVTVGPGEWKTDVNFEILAPS